MRAIWGPWRILMRFVASPLESLFTGALNVYKGAWYGTVIAISQAYGEHLRTQLYLLHGGLLSRTGLSWVPPPCLPGTAFYGAVTESRTTAKAISMDAVNKTAVRASLLIFHLALSACATTTMMVLSY